MPRLRSDRTALLLAPLAEGVAESMLYTYGPVYLRNVLGEPSLALVTLTLGAASLVMFGTANVWGRLGDRTGRHRELLSACLAAAGAGLLSLPFGRTTAAFAILTVGTSAFLAAVAPLGVAWLTITGSDRPALEAARFYRGRSAGWALGSLAAAGLVSAGPDGLVLGFRLAGALALAASLWLGVAAMRRRTAPETAPSHPPAPESCALPARPGEGVPRHGRARGSWRNPYVAGVVLSVLFTGTGNEAFFAVFGPYLTEYLGGPRALVGLSTGVASGLGILIAGAVGHLADRWGPERVFTLGTVAYTALYTVVATARHPAVVAAAFAAPLYPLLSTGAAGVLARRTPPEQRGEAIGLYEGTAALAAAAGGVLAGSVADAFGLARVPWLTLGLTAGGTLIACNRVARGTPHGEQSQPGEPRPAPPRP